MSDMGDMYRAMRERKRANKETKRLAELERLDAYIAGTYVKAELLEDWHVRLTGNGKRIDIFPLTRKYHIIATNKRGVYSSVEAFICEHYQI